MCQILSKRERNNDNDYQPEDNKRQRREEIIKIKSQRSYHNNDKYGLDLRRR